MQARLVAIATGLTGTAAARYAAGDALNWVGDPRPGVGLGPDGLPDIAWRVIPAAPSLPAYRISQYPITNAQFAAFVQDGGYTPRWQHCWTAAGWRWKGPRGGPSSYGGVFQLPNHPAVMISWYEAVAFCCWLSEKRRVAVALPTEAQWMQAACGSVTGPAGEPRYPGAGELTPDHANYGATGLAATSPVGIFPLGAHPETGVLDMIGNTWEWCRSVWREGGAVGDEADDGLEGEAPRVLRGGAFDDGEQSMSCAARSRNHPRARSRCRGFRVVAPADLETDPGAGI